MKTKLVILTLLVAFTAKAAQLIVDIPGSPSDPKSDVSRVSVAFGLMNGLGHNANMNEVAYYTQLWIISITQQSERNQAAAAYVPPPLAMQPSPTPTPTATPTATGTPSATPTPGLLRSVKASPTPKKK